MKKIIYHRTSSIKLRRKIIKEWMKDGVSQSDAEARATTSINFLNCFGPGHIEHIHAGNTTFQVRIEGDKSNE